MDHVHDCLVVGAGPAGSAAALRMAQDGLHIAECGSCRAICPQVVSQWRYPRGGYGVRYRWG